MRSEDEGLWQRTGERDQFGMPYLMQDVEEELDPSLEPVLAKAIIKVGNREIIRLGEKEIDYDHNFKFYLTTKLSNPHYAPEVSTKVVLVNFCVKEQGLEEQLLSIVVQEEEPSLEKRSQELVVRVAAGKRKLYDLESSILHLLSSAEGSLLDDPELVLTLQQSKTTSIEVTEQLEVAQETVKKIDVARKGYIPIATQTALLYFILNDFALVDPMYQFSLESYILLFLKSISLSKEKQQGSDAAESSGDSLADRIRTINEYHRLAVYRQTCLGCLRGTSSCSPSSLQ